MKLYRRCNNFFVVVEPANAKMCTCVLFCVLLDINTLYTLCIGPPTLRGNVLAAGGSGAIFILGTAEVYDSTMGNWTATASLATPRIFFQMVLLSDGHILAAGGSDGTFTLATAEVFDTIMGTWTGTASLATARLYFQMVLLANGNVLAAGGRTTDGNPTTSAEVYNSTRVRQAPG